MALHCWKELWQFRYTRYAQNDRTINVRLTSRQRPNISYTSTWGIARSFFSRLSNWAYGYGMAGDIWWKKGVRKGVHIGVAVFGLYILSRE